MGLLDDQFAGFDREGHRPGERSRRHVRATTTSGYTAFPSVPGGKGNLNDLAGNTENYYSVLKNTRYPDAVAAFLKIMYSPALRQEGAGDRQPDHDEEHSVADQRSDGALSEVAVRAW